MRYLLLAVFAVLLFLAVIRFDDLGITAQVALALACGAFFGRYLWVGFRTETMEAPGVGYLAGHRTENPILFWFCTAFNAIMLALTVVIAAKLAGL
ncbi:MULTISPECIES: hypothetical protein [unclassified Sphingopyxis]|uniref:hypothetical protein n=1 Tax=unclassified Sphingopyxis TaxID=2614943 RepID=UPI0007313AD1|nr:MULTISPECIES: hypothetical protein [unclassified Sphingopyxis]KTE23028.1 hypothetical protein ATE61_18455 [Sphingopyxis sp. H057]KTE49691.1 hypothetical protein ATE64_18810 [Sphingopyxis sp. H073]KTE54164.1 hypothetical protein ATE69_12215 [Sphingopyxis sp. H071]KTE57216.1 hypothetical protein ATE66_18005 [Sphingopyxis sp. H107]KTE60693.1 hypothetical protein ATE65_18925 [Sphingopyxis sp. H100]